MIMDEPNVFAGIAILVVVVSLGWFLNSWFRSYIASKAIKQIQADYKKRDPKEPEKI